MADLKKLCEAYRWARDNPENFEMSTWGATTEGFDATGKPEIIEVSMGVCGTTACLAGTVVWQAGGKLLMNQVWDPETDEPLPFWSTSDAVMPGGQRVDIETAAMKILELHPGEANRLFYTWNLAAVREIIKEMWDIDPNTFGLEE